MRGNIEEGLADPLTGAISEKDAQLLKFHGSYMQDERDLRLERQKQKLEPAYQYMIRVRLPGGVCTAAQWLHMDKLAMEYGGEALRLTTRQAVQFHNILKHKLKTVLQGLNEGEMTSLAACGDVNRVVTCSPNPFVSAIQEQVYQYCVQITEHLAPRTRAYHEIWLNGQRVDQEDAEEIEPIYGKLYLPRKFKIGAAIPPHNDVDVLSNDLGLIAIAQQEQLLGFNIAVGGGMGMTHGDTATYPRLADVIGFCPADKVVEVAEAVVKIQRDFGDRTNRKHARFKYTIDDRGIDWFKEELSRYLGWTLEPLREWTFESNGDRYGWIKGTDALWHLTLFIQNGRVKDWDDYALMTALREIALIHEGDFRVTPNQNIIIARVSEEKKAAIDALVSQYGLLDGKKQSALRQNAMACVAFPTCGLALAESERALPGLVGQLEKILENLDLAKEPITIRMTGCPNGCARPYMAEIGLVGKSAGKYNLYLGAGFEGQRLNKLYKESLTEEEVVKNLKPLFEQYAQERQTGEHFGDFVIRKNHIKAVNAGKEFHN